MLKELSNQEFNEFTSKYPMSSIYESAPYAFTMHEQGYDSLFLGYLDESNTIVAATLVLIEKKEGFKYAYAPRGFLIDYSNQDLLTKFTKDIKSYLGKKDVMAIKISPLIIKHIYNKDDQNNGNYDLIFNNLKNLGYYHMGYNNFFEAMKPRFEAIIDLTVPYTDIFKNYRKETRTKIRSGVTNGVSIHHGNKDDLNYLYLETKKKYPRDLKYFNDCFYFFGKENKIDFYYAELNTTTYITKVQNDYQLAEQESHKIDEQVLEDADKRKSHAVARKIGIDKRYDRAKKDLVMATNILRDNPNGLILASILCVRNNDEVYLLMDGYDTRYKNLNAKHLLLWKMIEVYSKMGYKKFNLGGCTNPKLENNPFKGLNLFKTNMGATIYEYAGDFELITNKGLYALYRNSAPFRNILKK